MQASKNKITKNAEPFYRLSVPKQKTSTEIINEARNALRTLRTQRPFTPAEDQRKLFGSGSSRAPQNRPPSVFSLHASSFDLAESRPVSGVRLSPLDHKPILVTFAKDEDTSISLPKPPADAAEVRKVSSARARLLRRTSQGNFLSAKMIPPDQSEEKLDSEEPAMMNNLCRSNNNCLAEQRSYTPFNVESRQLLHNERISRSEREDFLKGTEGKFLFQLRRERSVLLNDEMKKPDTSSSWPRSTGWKRRVTGLEDETRINESEEEEIFWHVKILPILHELEKEDNIENLCLACTKLYQALNEGNMLGKRFKRRSVLLKTLYKLVDVDSDPLCLKLAKIILAMKVDGKNLLSVCKLAFKICRNEKNDYIIQNDRLLDCLLEVLRTEDLQKNNEALLYCMGALKFMSGNTVLLNEMANKGAVEMFLQLMKQINNIKENDIHFSDLGHLLVQLTASLRNLADLPPARRQLLCNGAVSELCVALEQRMNDKDVCTYIVRIFSKLSSYNDFCGALADCSRCYILFLALLNKHQKQQAEENAAHKQSRRFLECTDDNFLGSMGREYKSVDDSEELVISAATTINNLSYYEVKSSAVQDKKLHIAEMLLKLLMSNSMDGVVEAVRVFGNLSRYHEICDFIILKKIHKFMIALLDAKNQDVCFSACGVLLNLTVDKNKRAFLMEEGGIGKLVDCLQDFGPADWQLACLICKTLWNYSEDITSAASCFGEDADTLLVLLTSLLDEELVLDYSLDRDSRDYHKLYWEREFKPVAEKLLDRIQSHHSFLPTVTTTPF
ncbi:armadillo repeat-containing protein 2 isoform X5 [Strix uralensis]|uniref:armadillo repeat-containing protein 2 isoform X5 n=1 Tax=Strix uralensis TaxID=36305 RepID=UPI003DA70C86